MPDDVPRGRRAAAGRGSPREERRAARRPGRPRARTAAGSCGSSGRTGRSSRSSSCLIVVSSALGVVSPFLLRAILDNAIQTPQYGPPTVDMQLLTLLAARDGRDRGHHRRVRRRPVVHLDAGRPERDARPAHRRSTATSSGSRSRSSRARAPARCRAGSRTTSAASTTSSPRPRPRSSRRSRR